MGVMLAEPGFHTRCYVEWEEYPQQAIVAAQKAGYFAPAPIWDDVTTFDGRPYRGAIDTILAGYPCQPFSQAGQRKGSDDERHLWPDIARIIREVEPRWVFLENVSGHVTLGADTVLRELHGMGYATAVGLFTAAETGAPQERKRWFCVAYCDREITSTDSGEPDCRPNGRNDIGGSGGATLGYTSLHHDTRGMDRRSDCAAPKRSESSDKEIRQASYGKRVRIESGSSGDDLACTDGEKRNRTQSKQRWRFGPTDDGGELADTSSAGFQGREWIGEARAKGPPNGYITKCGCPVADTSSTRTSPWRPEQNTGQQGVATQSINYSRPFHPPGPNDATAWARLAETSGDLAPALGVDEILAWAIHCAAAISKPSQAQIEPFVRRVVNGLAQRARALRLLGNGVHPLCAANAWRSLAYAHGLRPLDLAAGDRTAESGVDAA